MRILSICLLGLVCFSGCDTPNSPEVVQRNKAMLSGNGDEIGTLPDGRKVTRYIIDMGTDRHDHYIYVVPGSGSITKNSETGGKNSFNDIQAEISQ